MFKIIDNKKVEMTQDESTMFDNICKSYTTLTNNGEDLFEGLFETDDNGIILFLRPPSKKQTSLEVFLFLVALTTQQHLRLMYKQVDNVCIQMKSKMNEIDSKIQNLSSVK